MHSIAARLAHLKSHGARLAGHSLKQLIAREPDRAARMALKVDGLYANFARQHVDAEALDALLAVARASGMGAAIRELLHGASVNRSEGRPALHSALRTAFEAAYHALYGRTIPRLAIEVLTWTLSLAEDRPLPARIPDPPEAAAPAPMARRRIIDPGTGAHIECTTPITW